MTKLILFAVVAFGLSLAAAHAESPAQYCTRVANDDTVRPIPASLVATARTLFGLQHMPPAQIRRGTVFRCADQKLLLCNYGANLPCGKANTSTSLPGAADWCRQHPNDDFIPMYVTGHDTIYRWRCANGQAQAGAPTETVDARGFITRFWKLVD
jgi:hypothetical protein